MADKGYDADPLAQTIAEAGADVDIPPRRNRKVQRFFNIHLYREGNAVERFFCKI